ncbi:MAG: serine/threonine protein kinase [Holophagales bacterium]|nr:serine/threonine protein kinase [Holophagales bacterium]
MSSTHVRSIGPYRPLRKLGEGGMGVVHCAQDARNPDRLVALKVLSGSAFSAADDSARRFLRESRILENLRHPNIVSFYEVGLHDGRPYFAMELLSGSPLTAYAGRRWPETLPLLVQICDGMEYLASRSILHRDLSPDNIFVVDGAAGPTAKILDFGIAKDTTAEETLHNFTKTGLLMGKPPYWSPEQIGTLEAGETLDWRSDLYTLGIIFYRILAGHPPFQAESPVGYIPLHLDATPPPLSAPDGNPALPEDVVAIVLRMMSKRRADRPQSYGEIVVTLEGALRSLGAGEIPRPGLNPVAGVPDSLWTTKTKETAGFAGDRIDDGPTGRVVTRVTAGMPMEDETGPTVAIPTGRASSEATAPTFVSPSAPAQERRRGPLFAAAAGALAIMAVVGWLLLRPSATTAPPSPELSPGGPAATLALDAFPWGRIVSVRDPATGRRLASMEGLVTPRRLSLPPGRWEIAVASGVGPDVRTLTVDLAPGSTRIESVAFVTPENALPMLE